MPTYRPHTGKPHFWVLDGPYSGDQYERTSIAVGGRTCNVCGERDAQPVCRAMVRDSGRWPRWYRCQRTAKVTRPLLEKGESVDLEANVPANEDGTGYYCSTHDPEAVLARRAKADLRDRLRHQQDWMPRDVARQALHWLRDEEAVGEGICEGDCEHHTCRLARVVSAYRAMLARARELKV